MLSTWSLILCMLFNQETLYETSQGKAIFESKATLEKIIATSNEVKGIVDAETNNFSFMVHLDSFHGFNSKLQKNHYSENYVESELYPKASFKGKIIERVNFNKPGTYDVRAKGNFELHGVVFNKIINSRIIVINPTQFKIHADFQLNLVEYNIKVPRLVHKKVAENINISVDFIMNKQHS